MVNKNICRFLAAALLYFLVARFAGLFFVMPPTVNFAVFLPTVLTLATGPAAAFGCAAGQAALVATYPNVDSPFFCFLEVIIIFFSGFLPYKLWHTDKRNVFADPFAFDPRNLPKFIGIIFVTTAFLALLAGFAVPLPVAEKMFADADIVSFAPAFVSGLFFVINFNIVILFATPIFFYLISRQYNFYRPGDASKPTDADAADKTPDNDATATDNRAFNLLYAFFLLLFVTLDATGIIYDLDHMDTWLQFSGEILTALNITLAILMYMLLKYHHSIMANLTLLELINIFVGAFLLGSVSFVAISGIIGEHADNDLQKMSVIYRERLSHTFTGARMAINSMNRLALAQLTDYDQMKHDRAYRNNYLADMEREFTAITESTVGSIGFYMQLSPDIANDAGFIYTRQVENWGGKMPPFARQAENPFSDRYHVPYERYLASVSEPYLNRMNGNYMLSYVVPLQKDDRFIGIVGIDLDFAYIIHEIRRMSVYDHGYVALMDKNGTILYENESLASDVVNKGDLYETESYLSNGIWLKIAAYTHDIYAGRNDMLIRFVVVMLFVVVVASLFSIWLAGRGIRPLKLISAAAKKIAVGDLNVDLSYPAKNELGTLVDSIKDMAAKLDEHVYHDKLTGLLNTAAYVRAVGEMEKRRQAADERIEFAVAVFDANFLKKINDTYGHEAGNELIRRAAFLIKRVFAKSHVYRVGGDEFVAILEGADFVARRRLLEQFDREMEREYFVADGQTIKVSVARGLAVCEQAPDFAEVFRLADAEMYKHKAALKALREN